MVNMVHHLLRIVDHSYLNDNPMVGRWLTMVAKWLKNAQYILVHKWLIDTILVVNSSQLVQLMVDYQRDMS